jgi:2-hydroxychromene-2-carboxylate isomerase
MYLYTVLVGNSEGKRPFGTCRLRRMWDDNIEMDSNNILFKVADWIGLVEATDQWCAVTGTLMNLRVTSI